MAPRKSKNHIEGQLGLECLWAEPGEVVNERAQQTRQGNHEEARSAGRQKQDYGTMGSLGGHELQVRNAAEDSRLGSDR